MFARLNLVLPEQARKAIEAHARWCHPEEACGLIAFDADDRIRFVYPTTNVDGSTSSYTIDEVESFHAFTHSEGSGWEIRGVFHTHPNGYTELSARDLETAVDGWFYLLSTDDKLECWLMRNGEAVSVALTG